MIQVRAELHIHTVLSPCADLEMLPPLIVAECLERGIGLIAVTDHNASANIHAVQEAARGTGLVVLPGMEIQTCEDVHILCLFDTREQIRVWQQIVDASMPNLQLYPNYYGDQLVVNPAGEVISRDARELLSSTRLSITDVCEKVGELGGLAIPAHVNRSPNGLIPTLGRVPREIPFAVLEISRKIDPEIAVQMIPELKGYPLLLGGDAHRLDDLLGVNEFTVESLCIDEIKMALRGEDGRKFRILPV